MNTLMITSRDQGITFNAAEAVAPFAIIEKLASFAGALLKTVRGFKGVPALRSAHA
jgi:hypothetical protein